MSNTPSFVCAHSSYPEDVGAVISDAPTIKHAQGRGALFLPIDPPLLFETSMGGFVRRNWGLTGWKYNSNRGEGGSPLVLQVQPGAPFLHWLAEVRSIDSNAPALGKLQLWVDQTSVSTLNSGLTVLSSPPGFNLDLDTHYIRGTSRFQGNLPGFLALGLWGVCSNIKVTWVAVSQASHDQHHL